MRDKLVEIYTNDYKRIKHFLYLKTGYEYEYLFDDVINDVYIKLLSNKTFNCDKGKLKTYVYTCVLNELFMMIKTLNKKNKHELLYEKENEEFNEYECDEYINVLNMLKENEMFVDKYEKEMTYDELCIKYNLTLNQVKSKLRIFKFNILKKYSMRLYFEYKNGEKHFYKGTHSNIINQKIIAKEKLKRKQ